MTTPSGGWPIGPDAWRHAPGTEGERIACPLGLCRSHTTTRFTHWLERRVPHPAGGVLAAIMLNPSCPDEKNKMFGKVRNLCDEPSDRPTNRIVFLNVFAFRGRHLGLATEDDVRLPSAQNREVVAAALRDVDEVVVAWGNGDLPRPVRAAWCDEVAWFERTLFALDVPVLGMDGVALHPRAWKRRPGSGYRDRLQPLGSTRVKARPATPVSELATEPVTTNRQIEDAALRFVIAQEELEGRKAVDARGQGAAGDLLSGDHVIEVKASGGSARGNDMWLEVRQVEEALAHPDTFWLYMVENVRQGDPSHFRLIKFGGDDLAALLARRVERRYFTVPFPVSVSDGAIQEQMPPPKP